LPPNFASKPPTLSIEADGKIGGFAGVNSYFGEVDERKLEAGTVEVTDLGSTLMAGSPERMELEHQYLGRLEDARRAERRDGRLVLTADDGATLIYRPTRP